MPARLCTCVAALAASLPAQEPARSTAGEVFERVGVIPAVGGMIEDVCFPHDGKRMLTVGRAGDVVLWDFATLRPIARPKALPGRHSFRVACHPSRPIVAFGAEKSVVLHELTTGRRERIPLPQRIAHLAFSRTGQHLVAVTYHARNAFAVLLSGALDTLVGKRTRRVVALPEQWFGAPTFSRDDTTLHINRSQNNHVHLRIDLTDPKSRPRQVSGLAVGHAADGRVAYLREAGRELEIDLGARKIRLERPGSMQRFGNWRPVVRRGHAVWGAVVGKVRVRTPEADEDQEFSFPGAYQTPVFDVAPDGSTVVVDNQHRLHVIRAGIVHTLGEHGGRPHALAFSPDGRHIAAMGSAATVIADVKGRHPHTIPRPTAVAPGDTGPEFLVIGPRRALLWNAATQKPIREIARRDEPLRIISPMPSIRLCRARVFGDRRFVLVTCDPEKFDAPRHLHVLDRKSGTWSKLEPTNNSTLCRPGDAAARPGSREFAVAYVMPVLIDIQGGLTSDTSSLAIRSADGTLRRKVPLYSGPSAVAFNRDGKRLFVSEQDGNNRIFTAPDYKQVAAEKLEEELVAARWIEGDRILGFDGTHLVILDAQRLRMTARIELPKPKAPCVKLDLSTDPPAIAWSPDLKYCAVARVSHVELYRMRLPRPKRTP